MEIILSQRHKIDLVSQDVKIAVLILMQYCLLATLSKCNEVCFHYPVRLARVIGL